MSIKKYFDWRSWLEGFYLSWIKTVTTTLLAAFGSNAAEQLGVSGVGLNLKQDGSVLVSLTIFEVLKYLQTKPMPDVKTEEVETTFVKKDVGTKPAETKE